MKVVIVGGGISGLAVAYALIHRTPSKQPAGKQNTEPAYRTGRHRTQMDVTVLEAGSRPGGKIWSDKVDGFLCEKGTNGFLDNKPKTLELCKSLGLEPLQSNENAKIRFIFSNKRLNELSGSPVSFLKSGLFSWRGKLRMMYEIIAPKGPEDETVADFVIRRLGKEGLDKLIDPMCSGVFAGDPYKMSVKHCFPRIKELEQEYGSLIKALIKIQRAKSKEQRDEGRGTRDEGRVSATPGGNLTSFYNGAQVITDALAEKLGERVKLGISVQGLARLGRRLAGESGSARGGKKGNSYQLHTSEGIVDADVVVLASPAYASAEILKGFNTEVSKILMGIPYPPVSVVCFGYKREKVLHSLRGFGFLVPHIEGIKILGNLWDSSIFPNRAPEGYVLLRSMVGGAQSHGTAMLSDNELINMVFDELKPIISLKTEPDMVRIYRWERAIPQYLLGHGEKLKSIGELLKSHPGLYLAGNAYRGISMNDCIENGYKVADEILSAIILP